ncbi:hypothetical protein LCGC14_1188880 [marine sediment metagenome]|uniref:Uncharacterized protein n=1 Tax=marine sediment metagenome TaxID=412755 RepID=A0A0F9LK40_9ZZZZ
MTTPKVIPPDPDEDFVSDDWEPVSVPRTRVQVPPDKDKLARWLGDGQALLARLQESFGELFLLQDVTQLSALGLHRSVAELIRVAREHFQELPHED